MAFLRRPWEHWTRKNQQLALAGSTPRAEYLRSRKEAVDELITYLEIRPESVGFEIGSGEGIVARDLASHCASIDCTDISRTFLKLARRTCKDVSNVHFHLIKNHFLSFLPADRYDFGYSSNVFIHLNPYEILYYLQSVRRLLKPSGSFFFTGATLGDDTIELFRFFAQRFRRLGESRPGFMRWADLPMIERIAQEADLQVDHSRCWQTSGHLKIVVQPISS